MKSSQYKNILNDSLFLKKDVKIFGEDCVLITPAGMEVKWNDENKDFRSAIIRKSDEKCISRNWRKFTNFGETPDFEPWNPKWEFDARKKIDGSAILASKIRGNLLVRTRGTTDARQMPNGNEIDPLVQKYKRVFNNKFINSEEYTILLEWITPTNRIVVRESDDPDFVLLGIIHNETSRYVKQSTLDVLGLTWEIRRPEIFHYTSMAECLDDVKAWQDKEGVVLYHEQTQTLKKIKADLYLSRHRLKSHISSISNLVDFYMTTSKSADYNDFFKTVEQSLDFELATQAAKDIEKVVDAHQKIKLDCFGVQGYISIIGELPRKEAAAKIIARYPDWRKSYAFMALDNKPMPDKMLADLIIQNCK